jgi:hypothetical protein
MKLFLFVPYVQTIFITLVMLRHLETETFVLLL